MTEEPILYCKHPDNRREERDLKLQWASEKDQFYTLEAKNDFQEYCKAKSDFPIKICE